VISAIIIDDKKRNASFLSGLLKEYCPEVELLGEANSVKTGVELINAVKPSLVFLDVEMPDGTGFDLLEQLHEKDFNVIFTTAHDHYALRAIKFSALDYLLKPINYLELQAAIEKVKEEKQDDSLLNNISMLLKNLTPASGKPTGKIAFPDMEGHTFVDISDIVRLEADGNYTHVYMADGSKILASRTLKEFEVFIDKYDFVRIHRTHVINMNHIKNYIKGNGGYVVMDDGSTAEVSVRKKDEFLRKISMR
jgi:two-component system LytT family response regulator